MKIAVGNVGSTSLKTKIFDMGEDNTASQLGQADFDRVNVEGDSTFKSSVGGERLKKESVSVFGYEQALRFALDFYLRSGVIGEYNDIEAVGFKTVLAGSRGACVLSDTVIDEMKRYAFVAPAHNLPYIETIEQFRNVLGDVPLIGVFETSFHYSIPRFRRLTGLPLELEEKLGLEQRGFHGASGRYGAARVRQMHETFTRENHIPFPEPFKVIFNHLGGSCSTHALLDGRSVATSMGLSLQAGHFQGKRVGDIDIGAVLYAMKELGLSVDEMNDIVSGKSGLKGMSGIESGEMADIMDASDRGEGRAALARDAFIDRVRQYIGAYSAVLGGVDAVVFSGGIGENGVEFRARVCEGFGYLGLELDQEKNRSLRGQDGRISTDSSAVQAYVVRTNEELVVAHFTREVARKGRDLRADQMTFVL
jgi:acetate kinase